MTLNSQTHTPRTLVIGANGFAGTYLVTELKKAGHEIITADLPDFDLLNQPAIENLVKTAQPNFVVNLAAISSVGASWKEPAATIQVNVVGTLILLDAIVKHAPNAKTLLIGSSEEYAPGNLKLSENRDLVASNPYGISKIAQENFADLYRKKYGIKIVCTRSFNHTGVGQCASFVLPSFVQQVAKIEKTGKPGTIKVGNLEAIRDFSDVRDIVHVYRMLLENDTKYNIYNVGSGIAHKIADILETIISFASVDIKVEQDPEKMRPVDMPYQCCDNSRIVELGYWNGTKIEDTLKWMFEHEVGTENRD